MRSDLLLTNNTLLHYMSACLITQRKIMHQNIVDNPSPSPSISWQHFFQPLLSKLPPDPRSYTHTIQFFFGGTLRIFSRLLLFADYCYLRCGLVKQ